MRLSDVQARRLYRILDELTVYANKTRRIVAAEELFDPLTHEVTDYARTEVLPVVWDVPEIIDEFVKRNPAGLPQRDLDEALRWKDNVSGYALLLDYDASGRALFELGDDVVAVAGISRDISHVIARKPPLFVDLTMIPFENVVTYDTIVRLQEVRQGPGIQRMMEQERASLGVKRTIVRADDFIEAAREERARRREEDLKRLEEQLEHERIEAGGEEKLPEGIRRGSLAGLSEDARAKAVTEAIQEFVAGDPTSSTSGRSLAKERLKRLKERASYHPPVTRLEDTLDADNKSILEREAMRLGIKRFSKMRKAELAHAVATAMLEGDSASQELSTFLKNCFDAEYKTFKRLLSLPQRAVEFSEQEAGEYSDWVFYPPYSRLFYHKGTFAAVIPDEYREAAEAIDFAAIDAGRKRAQQIAHAGEVLVDLRGAVPVRDVVACVRKLYGFEPTEEEVIDGLYEAADREMPYPPFEFWRPLRSRKRLEPETEGPKSGSHSGAGSVEEGPASWYIVHFSLGDHMVSGQVAQRLSREMESLYGKGLSPEKLSEQISRLIDPDESYKKLERSLKERDAYIEDLLRCHQEKEGLGPCPVDPALAEVDVMEWKTALPQAMSLRNWLDAHVPEDANDRLFADDVVERLIEAHDMSDDPQAIVREAADLDLLTLSDDYQGVIGRLMALANALPIWTNNGWSPMAIHEREVGHRVFYNPDGTEMRVGRNDPCPCGSGKKYKKCCGR